MFEELNTTLKIKEPKNMVKCSTIT